MHAVSSLLAETDKHSVVFRIRTYLFVCLIPNVDFSALPVLQLHLNDGLMFKLGMRCG
jgi:hypothetical protein